MWHTAAGVVRGHHWWLAGDRSRRRPRRKALFSGTVPMLLASVLQTLAEFLRTAREDQNGKRAPSSAAATARANVGAARSAPGRTPGGPAKGSPS